MKLRLGMKILKSVRARLVYWLICSIYRLKQSNKLYNQKIIAFFQSLGFAVLNSDFNILIYQESRGNITIVSIYIDNFLLVLKNYKSVN